MATADTTETAARVQRATLASKTGEERTSMAFEMSELVRQLTIDGIRQRRPGISTAELGLSLLERLHGAELAQAVAASRPGPGGS